MLKFRLTKLIGKLYNMVTIKRGVYEMIVLKHSIFTTSNNVTRLKYRSF